MKKLLLIVLATITLPLTAIAADGDVFTADVDDVEMTFKIISEAAKTCQVGDGSYSCINRSYSGSLSIPSSVNDYTVKSIGKYAFYKCSGLTSVTIPESVTSIGSFAFLGCSGLTSETIPNSVTSIGSEAFEGCSGLTSVTIPNSVTSIGEGAFVDCSGLTSVTIPNSVTSIGRHAFYKCSSLTSVNITDIVAWCNIHFYSAESNPLYYAHNLYIDGNKITDLTIPESVTSIGNYAFRGCSGLTSVTIPNSVTSIGWAAFYGCSGLTSVTITDIVAWCNIHFYSAESNPLYYAHNLYIDGNKITDLTIPESVTSIGNYAFYGFSGLTSVTLPNAITFIVNTSFPGSCKLFTNIGSSTLLALWKGDRIAYNAETGEVIQRPRLVFKNRTQTTLSFDVEPHYSDYTYDSDKGILKADDNHVVVSGLLPETIYDNHLVIMCCGSVKCDVESTSFTTSSITPSVKSMQTTASSLLVGGSYIKGDAEVVSQTIQVAGINQEGNEMTVTGLEPGKTYDASYAITVRYGAGGEYTYPKSVIRTAIFVVDFVTDWLQAFCNLIFLMTAIRKMILQITYFQDITDLTTNFYTSNDRFGLINIAVRARLQPTHWC